MELGIRGRTALISGAAGGIGRAAARVLAAEGVRIALVDLDGPAVADAAAELNAAGFEACGFSADLTHEGQVATAVGAAVDRFGGIDLLVGCAGISGPVGTPFGETALADWERVLAVNVTGSFLLLRHALPALRRSSAASVVFVASDSALVAVPGMVPYCASKAAVVQFARAAAVELAADGVRVNVVCPSIVDTPMSRGDLGRDDFADVPYPVQSPTEVATQIAFLCSPVSRPITAAALVSDFGYTARSNFPA